ncbi:MAG: DNA replication protein DnaD, partial [Lachnospiraceae bacterium]|nr:DNA replication protein DnaD [Lachnospiraceae bacterium]
MTSIKISNPYSIDSISISNTFIDYYMPPANGEFVKVYLYLLRAANSNYSPTIADMADALSHTESDILRALKYW